MSKKKKTNHRRKKRAKSPYDRHHIFYIRSEWSKGCLNELRLYPYCIISMHRDTIHRYMHTHLSHIPVPRACSVEYVLAQLRCLEEHGVIGLDDPIEKRLAILIALFECIEQPTSDALRKQLDLVHEFKKAP